MEPKDIHILLIDDDAIVHKAMRRVLEEEGMTNPLLTAKNGEEGLAVLRSDDAPNKHDLPLLIILDLNMPKMDGHEFLKQMRADEDLNNLPVFVLTTSKVPKDLGDAYDMAVIGYVIKDDLSESFKKALTVLDQTWRFE